MTQLIFKIILIDKRSNLVQTDINQFHLVKRKGDIGKDAMGSYAFDQNVAKKKLAHMITMHEYPLSMVKHEAFREIYTDLQSAFKKHDLEFHITRAFNLCCDLVDEYALKFKVSEGSSSYGSQSNTSNKAYFEEDSDGDGDGESEEVECKSSSSFLWKSFVWGRDLLEVGGHWRIGNGASMHIDKDRWILMPLTFRVVSPTVLGERLLCPQMLIFLSVELRLTRRNEQVHGSNSAHDEDLVPWVESFLAVLLPAIAVPVAIQRGLLFVIETDLAHYTLESDAQTVVNHINSNSSLYSDIGLIISDIYHFLVDHTGCNIVIAPK
ncbi:hypothetical protein Dsin_025263 [Dipteronia sinensis]|uniref:Uncharacterized protein n=1 Tax=Dipteronia sinensis TaxID=43782 RepID=A0AAE0DWY3_9ROSI|nr:hypothetical protein Dsin_025263 [Dipteronia sinensis]